MIYNRGPRHDPCGTPQSRERLSERAPEIETRCLLAVKYEMVLQKFQMKFEVYAEVKSSQLYRKLRSSLIKQEEQHAENLFSSEYR